MGRSQETFGKKENEKKKQQKRKQKAEKKEERKASSKDSSLDSMIAYVDEFGNFSSTPPDPKAKTSVDASNIKVGISRREEVEQDTVRTGIVTFFNESKGYGFIKDQQTQESVFVHSQGLIDAIKENNKVSFEVENTPKGLSAIKVKIVR